MIFFLRRIFFFLFDEYFFFLQWRFFFVQSNFFYFYIIFNLFNDCVVSDFIYLLYRRIEYLFSSMKKFLFGVEYFSSMSKKNSSISKKNIRYRIKIIRHRRNFIRYRINKFDLFYQRRKRKKINIWSSFVFFLHIL